MLSVEGVVLNGPQAGWRIRVEDDRANTGGYLIITEHPHDEQRGGDNWVATFADIELGLAQVGWQVEWQQPLSSLK